MNEKLKSLILGRKMKKKVGHYREKDLWIFSSVDNRHFNYNARALFLYVMNHCPELRPRYVVNDPLLRERLARQYGSEYFIDTTTEEGVETALKAGAWFMSAGMPVYGTHLNHKRAVVNLWHGVPLKKIVLEDPSEGKLFRLYFKKIFADNYTHVMATSPEINRVMQRGLGVESDRVFNWGQPRNDILQESFDREAYLGLKYHGLADYKQVVLYAPTFRNGKPVRLFPFEDFDRKDLEETLRREKILLLIRTHIDEAAGQTIEESDCIRYFNADIAEDVMEALSGMDMVITDYSSIYIDYLLVDKPIMFLPYDLEEYQRDHGFCFPYREVTPGPKPTTYEEFKEKLIGELKEDHYRQDRSIVRERFDQVDYPCSPRIVQEIKAYLNRNL